MNVVAREDEANDEDDTRHSYQTPGARLGGPRETTNKRQRDAQPDQCIGGFVIARRLFACPRLPVRRVALVLNHTEHDEVDNELDQSN